MAVMATKTSTGVIFDSLSRNLSSLAYAKSENDKILLRRILNDFNEISYNDAWTVVNERAVLVVNQCCFLVPTDDDLLVKNVLQLFHSLLSKQNITVEGKTLSVAITWTLDVLKRKNADSVNLALSVLQELIQAKSHKIQEFTEKILNTCLNFLTEYSNQDPPEITLNALNCIESLTRSQEDEEYLDSVVPKSCEIFFKILYEDVKISHGVWKCKCCVTAMRGLSNIVQRDISLVSEILPEIFGCIKGYMLYGVDGEHYHVDKIHPSNIALPEEMKPSQPVKKSIGKYDKKSKKKNLTPISKISKDDENLYTQDVPKFCVTSDSDFSESESANNGKLRHACSKVRRCSLILFGTVLMKGDLKNLTRFLPSFLPDGSQTRTLITCLLKDPSAGNRSEVLRILSIIFTKFKPFMLLADSKSHSSFTTLSNNVAEIQKQVHIALTSALKTENYKIVTTHILKTISDLIRCSPYHKLEENLLKNLGREVEACLKKRDVNVEIAALVVFGCIVSISPQIDEIGDVVFRDDWLFLYCERVLNDDVNFNPAVAVECLQVLAAMIRNFPFRTVVSSPMDVIKLLGFTSSGHDFIIRLYAAKLMEAVVHAVQISIAQEDPSKRIPVDSAVSLWREIIHGPLTSLIQSEDHHALRSAACNCLANLSILNESMENSLIFDELPRSDQIICITHLFGCAKDQETQVRSAAIRALAVLVQFPTLRQDSLFFLDTTDLFFIAANDNDIHVRNQAAWLFRHIAEAASMNHSEGLEDDLSDELVLRLLETGVKLSKDDKKGKPYAVRGIANLLAMVNDDLVLEKKEEIHRAVDALIVNATSGTFMKARWNACYALGAVLANRCVCFETRGKIFPPLFDLVQNYKNFKVRISTGCALASAKDRESYSEFYLPTWQALLHGLENAQHMTDFSEYQHRDHLVDQLCSCMCHLTSLITPQDLTPVQEILLHYIDDLNNQFQRFKNRIIPEKGSNIARASARLSELRCDGSLTCDQKNALMHISNLFL